MKSREAALLALLFCPFVGFSQPKVAVLPFRTGGEAASLDIAKSLPDMLMTNLAESNQITLVERSQVDRAIKNFQIESSQLFDESTAVKAGRWIGATHVILGSIYGAGSQIRIDVRIVNVERGIIISSAKVEGPSRELFSLVNDASSRLLAAFTGEKRDFREAPSALVDREFTITPRTIAHMNEDDWFDELEVLSHAIESAHLVIHGTVQASMWMEGTGAYAGETVKLFITAEDNSDDLSGQYIFSVNDHSERKQRFRNTFDFKGTRYVFEVDEVSRQIVTFSQFDRHLARLTLRIRVRKP
jgi:TolB-like protein